MTHPRNKPSEENKRFPVRLIFTGDSTYITIGTTVTLKKRIQSFLIVLCKSKDGLENILGMMTCI
jgi:polyhydroxyalkanoate synthesis regulator protein